MANDINYKRLAGPGIAFLAAGIVFLIVGVTGQTPFIAVGAAFLTLGIVLLGKSRQRGDAP